MDFESSDPQEADSTDMIFALAATSDCQPGSAGRVFAARSSGLYVSEDGGSHWENALASIGLSEPLPITSLAVATFSEQVAHVFAGGPGCIFRSTDSGQTWRMVLLPTPPPTVSALAASPNYAEDQTIFAGTVDDGIFISRDGGNTFAAWNFGLLDLNVMSLVISPDFASDETLFAGTETGIFQSTNGGRAWRDIDLPHGFDAVFSLAASPNFSLDGGGMLFAATEKHGLWRSIDGGDTWQPMPVDADSEPINVILVRPQNLIVITGAGLFQSGAPGSPWQSLLSPADQDRQPIAILPTHGQVTLVSFADGAIEVVRME